jgi:hypothetical protein
MMSTLRFQARHLIGVTAKRAMWAVILVACLLGFWLIFKYHEQNAEGVLIIDKAQLDMGRIWEIPDFKYPITLTNASNKPLHITSFHASCSCTSIEPNSFKLLPFESGTLNLTFDLTHRPNREDASTASFDVEIQPVFGSKIPQQKAWHFFAEVIRAYSASPASIDFEDTLTRGQPFASRHVRLTSAVEIADLHESGAHPGIQITVTRACRQPDVFDLEVNPQADLPAGRLAMNMHFVGLTPDGAQVPGAIPVLGRVLEDVYASPEAIVFGARPLYTTVEDTLLIQSRTDKILWLTKTSSDDPEVKTILLPTARSGCLAFKVSQRVSRQGSSRGTVTLCGTLSGQKSESWKINVPVSYHGIKPD